MTAPAASAELPALDALDDAGLQALIQRAGELLREREQARQREAIEQARAILAGAGLSVQDMIGRTPRASARAKSAGSANAGTLRRGTRYANPADPSQVYVAGRGREPRWFKALRDAGTLPAPID